MFEVGVYVEKDPLPVCDLKADYFYRLRVKERVHAVVKVTGDVPASESIEMDVEGIQFFAVGHFGATGILSLDVDRFQVVSIGHV